MAEMNMDRIYESLEKLHNKSDKNLDEIHKTQVEAAKTTEHLKTLNGRVENNVKNIAKGDKRLGVVEKRMAKWGGAIAAIIILLQVGLYGLGG